MTAWIDYLASTMSSFASILLFVLQLVALGATRAIAPASAASAGARPAAWVAQELQDRAAPIDRGTAHATVHARVVHARTVATATPALTPVASIAAIGGEAPRPTATSSHALAARGEHLPYFPTAPPVGR